MSPRGDTLRFPPPPGGRPATLDDLALALRALQEDLAGLRRAFEVLLAVDRVREKGLRLAAASGAPAPAPPQPPAGPPPCRLTVEERAVAVLLTSPGLTNKEIAERAGCSRVHLSRLPLFRHYRALLREMARAGRPRGFRTRGPGGVDGVRLPGDGEGEADGE